jgi:hypothetical protein
MDHLKTIWDDLGLAFGWRFVRFAFIDLTVWAIASVAVVVYILRPKACPVCGSIVTADDRQLHLEWHDQQKH